MEVQTEPGVSLLTLLRNHGVYIDSYCGGNGTCGKCLVNVKEPGSDEYKEVLSCRYNVESDITVEVPDPDHANLAVETGFAAEEEHAAGQDLSASGFAKGSQGYGAACDLGTTTVALKLIDLATGTELAGESGRNAQTTYGADVITRIQYITEHQASERSGLEELSDIIRTQIRDMIVSSAEEAGINTSEIRFMFLAGNTIMQHIFAGISPESIAKAPFTPETLFDGGEVLDLDIIPGMKTYLSPCVAGYVGGDITAGVLSSGADTKDETSLFLDVGTNGEMALGGSGGFICCSVASGPAFEGAEIACGMAGAPGAIDSVELINSGSPEKPKYTGLKWTSIGDTKPKGICGSGLIDLLAALLECGIVDETGRMLPPDEALDEGVSEGLLSSLGEDEDGNGIFYLTSDKSVYFTASDVRKLQLAKGAIMAGICVMLKSQGLQASDLAKLYLAGGFGRHIRPESAARIGMIPRELTDRIVYLGNASLKGAEIALTSQPEREHLFRLCKRFKYIELSGMSDFSDEFMEQMMFEEDN